MAVFRNVKTDSPITSVEFSPVSDGNFSFFSIDSPISVKGAKDWLTTPNIGQEVIAETQVDGHPVLVTYGDKKASELMGELKKRGENLALYERKKTFPERVWPMGASIATVGQVMQLTASFLRPNRKPDWALRMFAIPNLTASAWTFFYGAQRSKDPNRLLYMKRHFNEELGSHVPGGMDVLPDVNDTRLRLHKDESKPKTTAAKVNQFLERNSVTVGEIGLRYLGATAIAFPMDRWGKGFNRLMEGQFKEAYKATRNDKLWTHRAGLLSLAGKTVAITSKAEDPYSPKPPNMLDKIRQKYTFRTGGWMETIAFATLAADGFAHKKISFTKGGTEYRDFISGIGGTLFTIRYAMRHWAPFGVRETNMPELYAHVTDSLAKMPPDKLPQLLADTAADITDQFKDKHLKYGEVFTQLLTDLYRYHHIALDNLGTQPEERLVKVNGHAPVAKAPEEPDPKQPILAKQTLKTAKATTIERDEKLAKATHVEKVKSHETGQEILR